MLNVIIPDACQPQDAQLGPGDSATFMLRSKCGVLYVRRGSKVCILLFDIWTADSFTIFGDREGLIDVSHERLSSEITVTSLHSSGAIGCLFLT